MTQEDDRELLNEKFREIGTQLVIGMAISRAEKRGDMTSIKKLLESEENWTPRLMGWLCKALEEPKNPKKFRLIPKMIDQKQEKIETIQHHKHIAKHIHYVRLTDPKANTNIKAFKIVNELLKHHGHTVYSLKTMETIYRKHRPPEGKNKELFIQNLIAEQEAEERSENIQ